MLPEVGKLPDLGIGGIGRKNPSDTIGALPASEPITVVPKEFAEGIGITFVGLIHGGVIRLDDDDFGASSLLEFFK